MVRAIGGAGGPMEHAFFESCVQRIEPAEMEVDGVAEPRQQPASRTASCPGAATAGAGAQIHLTDSPRRHHALQLLEDRANIM